MKSRAERPIVAYGTPKIGRVVASPSEAAEKRDPWIKIGAGDADSRGGDGELALGTADVGPLFDDLERHARGNFCCRNRCMLREPIEELLRLTTSEHRQSMDGCRRRELERRARGKRVLEERFAAHDVKIVC